MSMSKSRLSTTYTSTTRASTSRPMTRPATAARTNTARPSTSRPGTKHTDTSDTTITVALFESRGVAREVGIAAMDRDTGRVVLVQLADCPTYVKTLHQMHVHWPSVVLVPETFVANAHGADAANTGSSLLTMFVTEEFPEARVEPVPRKWWSDAAGMEFITQLCVEDHERAAMLVSVADKYYALSAAGALFKHSESRLNTRFATGSLKIRYAPVEGTLMIDMETARNLELVGNAVHRKSGHSLFGVLNHTYTSMATRLLRANILAPLTAEGAINARLDAVEELIQNENRFSDVRDALKRLNKLDFDKLISSLASSEVRVSNAAKSAYSRVSQMLGLQSIVRNLPFLQKALAGTRSQLLQIAYEMLSDKRLALIGDLVADNLNEEAGPVKGGLAAVNARVYAVKANRHRLLDVARETFKENVGDIMQLSTTLSEKHALPISLVYQESGFVFVLKKTEWEGELPKGFLHVSSQKGRWLFSSMELKKMNARMRDALDETLILSNKIIQDLVLQILMYSGALYTASEAIALVDLLRSFAHTSIMRNYVRPELTGTLAVKSGRHPILETVQAAGTLVPNDIYCCDASYFQIVQGPNMSGKSTYLRQTGLLVIMAMCGCFVPAEYASFRIHDALLTRLSNDDDMEKSLSTFAHEMTTSAMILGLATPNTLVLVDELGRGTSTIEGIGIAHAIAEELIHIKCFVFFATHFHELSTTLSHQPAVVNLHLSVQRAHKSTAGLGIVFKYRIVDGLPEDLGHYGLQLARLADLPPDVMEEGKTVAAALADLHAQQERESESNVLAIHRRAVLKLRTQLTQAFEHCALPDSELVSYLARFQKNLIRVFHETSSV